MKKKRLVEVRKRRPDKPEEPVSTGRRITFGAARFALELTNRWVGVFCLVICCGVLMLGWSTAQSWWQMRAVQQGASASAHARLIDRYYRLTPAAVDEEYAQGCGGLCLIDMVGVAVFEFSPAPGRQQRVEFVDTWAHEPGVSTPMERGIPLLGAIVRLPSDFERTLHREHSISHPELSLWDEWWERFDDSALWLSRVRNPAPEFSTTVRFDPDQPSIAMLDLPEMREQAAKDLAEAQTQALSMLPFVFVLCAMVLHPSLMMVFGRPRTRRVRVAITLAVALGVPLWAPFALKLAHLLSSTAGRMADVMALDFANSGPPAWLAAPVTPTAGMNRQTWSMASSEDSWFLRGLEWEPAPVGALDDAAAYDHVRASFSRQLLALPVEQRDELVAGLNHYRAQGALELLAPALVELSRNAVDGIEEAALINRVLRFHFADWPLPAPTTYLAAHRVSAYEQTARSASKDMGEIAQRRANEWRRTASRH